MLQPRLDHRRSPSFSWMLLKRTLVIWWIEMSQHQLSALPSCPPLILKPVQSLLPQQPCRWRQHLLLFWTFYFFLFLSDQIELVEPLTQGLPKHVCEVKLWRENEWRPWAFVELENQFIWRTTSCLWSNQADLKPATRTKTSSHGWIQQSRAARANWRGWLFHVIILFKKKNTEKQMEEWKKNKKTRAPRDGVLQL